jgi:hypothetical protein
MSLQGNLEDVRAADVIQFVYIGARSGTLRIDTPVGRRAVIGFHDGLISNAWLSDTPRLGELLVTAGLLSPSALKLAEAAQRAEGRRPRPIGRIFISKGLVTEAQIRKQLMERFARMVHEIVTWPRGTFQFLPNDRWPIEELSSSADDEAGRVQLDMAGLLRDLALRVQQPAALGEPVTGMGTVADFETEATLVDAVPPGGGDERHGPEWRG